MSDDRAERDFVDRHLQRAIASAGRRGFAVDQSARILTPAERRQRVLGRLTLATSALTDLQQWLEDDDPAVRASAREAVHRCLQIAYTGDQPEPTRGLLERCLNWVDRRLGNVLKRRVDPDAPMPQWALPTALRRARGAGIAVVFAFSLGVALAFASGAFLTAIGLLCVVSAVDTLEGSFARVTRMRDPQMRWLSCVFSHLDDLVIMLGIAAAAPEGLSTIALGAALASVFGSLVRVSALQAGYRFWRSPAERVARFSAFLVFAVLASVDEVTGGIVLAASLLCMFALAESIRVVRRVGRRRVASGGFIFLTNDGADCWSFEEVDEVQPEASILGRSARHVSEVSEDDLDRLSGSVRSDRNW